MSLNGKATASKVLRGRISGADTVLVDAYAVAVRNGFEGTEEEWLASLQGSESLLIRVTANDSGYTADKTIDDIQTADMDNIPCVCYYNGGYLQQTLLKDGVAYFSGVIFGKEIRVGIGSSVTVAETSLANESEEGGTAALPAVTEEDDGKILQVLDGAWEVVDPTMPEGVVGDGVTNDAPAIQALLDANDCVCLPEGTYLLQNNLKMSRDHCIFICRGTLLVDTTTALELEASYCHVKIAHIKSKYNGSWSAETSWVFPVNGIKLGSETVRVYYNTVEVDYIERCKNGIWMVPVGDNTGVSHNIIRFGDIFAEYGIHFQPGDGAYVFVSANHFYGGKLRGKHPVYTEPGTNQTDDFNGNTFNHIAVESCQREMVFGFFCYNAIRDMRHTPAENGIAYPNPYMIFDEHSFGNVISIHGNVNIDQIVDPYKSGTTWTWAQWMGNAYEGKGIVCGEQGVETFLGYKARSSCGQFIVPNEAGINFTGDNADIDMSDYTYAVDGAVCYCKAETANVVIKLSKGYRKHGAQTLYVYVAEKTDPYTVQVTQFDELTQADVVIVPASVFNGVGMYKLECLTAIGWVASKIASSYILPEEQVPTLEPPVEEPSVDPSTLVSLANWYDVDAAGAGMDTITSVEFSNSYTPTGTEDASWAADVDGTGSIMAYRTGTSVVVATTDGAKKIKLNADSRYMFAAGGSTTDLGQFSNLAQVTGTEIFVADAGTTMKQVCQKNTALTTPICIPDGVTSIATAFSGCNALTEPPVLPDTITNMGSAFINCSALTTLPNIPENVQDLSYAFQACTSLTDVSGCVIPESATTIRAMFNGATGIDGTIEINATSLTDYANAFKSAPNTYSKAIRLTGSCPVLAEIAATNTSGYVVVA